MPPSTNDLLDASTADGPLPRQPLSGWGRYPVVESRVVRPESQSALEAALQDALAAGDVLLARGAGRSYGDAALTSDGRTILTKRLTRMLHFDADRGVLRAEAGCRLGDVVTTFVPRGWFLPVTPGTKHVTLGGAVAFDVHGKNHHCDGGFGNFVEAFTLVLASGDAVRCSRTDRPDLFWATIGGAGLTGIITEVTLRLRPIETAFVRTRTLKAAHLDDAFALFETHEPDHTYAVAWIDCLATGASLGRSLCMFGDHAAPHDLDARRADAPLHYTPSRLLDLPTDLPAGLLNRWTVRAFNQLFYARQRSRDAHAVEGLDSFFYPLDVLGHWNRMYGRRGFVQYQCVLPLAESNAGLRALLQRLSAAGRASFLAVLKRMGPQEDGLLSFPMRGYTLALDLPMRKGLPAFIRELDRIVLNHGGRVYLAKDALLSSTAVRAMYPRLDEWLDVKRAVDPTGRFTSDLATRLALVP